MITANRLRTIVPVLLATLVAGTAGGQTVSYLTPAEYAGDVGGSVSVHVDAGEGERVRRSEWPTERIAWLFVRSPGAQQNREDVNPAEAGGDTIRVELTRPGVTLVGLDTRPTVVAVSGKRLKAFVERMALRRADADTVAAIDDEDTVRVRRVESAKTLVRVADPGGRPATHSQVAQSKTGQKVEIRALTDPTMVPVGSDLPVKAYLRGDKSVGVKVLATCVATGKTAEATTDSTGACHFTLTDAGVWRIEFHDAELLEQDAEADWVIHSATLTFETAGTGAGK